MDKLLTRFFIFLTYHEHTKFEQNRLT